MRYTLIIHTECGNVRISLSALFLDNFIDDCDNYGDYTLYQLVEYCHYLIVNNSWQHKSKLLNKRYRMFLRYMETFMQFDYGCIIEIKKI